jgi:hypothetical protein
MVLKSLEHIFGDKPVRDEEINYLLQNAISEERCKIFILKDSDRIEEIKSAVQDGHEWISNASVVLIFCSSKPTMDAMMKTNMIGMGIGFRAESMGLQATRASMFGSRQFDRNKILEALNQNESVGEGICPLVVVAIGHPVERGMPPDTSNWQMS